MWPGLSPWFTPFFFNDTATTEIYTLSLHDALPICSGASRLRRQRHGLPVRTHTDAPARQRVFAQVDRSEEHTSELQSQSNLVCRLLLEKKETRGASPRAGPPPRSCRWRSRRSVARAATARCGSTRQENCPGRSRASRSCPDSASCGRCERAAGRRV